MSERSVPHGPLAARGDRVGGTDEEVESGGERSVATPPTFSARQVVHRLLGDAPLAGWAITDVRASSGLRVTLSHAIAESSQEVVVIFRTSGQPGFFSNPRLSAMLLGTSAPEYRPLLHEVEARVRTTIELFPAGEIEAILEEAALRLAPVHAPDVNERQLRPGEVEIRLNLVCNQTCFFCNCDGFAPNVVPSAPAAIESARQLGRRGVGSAVITGGEPTLNHALLDVVRAARDGGVERIMVQSNAVRLAEPGFSETLRDAGVTALFISLHSQYAAVSDRITGVEGTHALTLRGIDAALGSGLSVTTNFVINALNADEPPAYVAWLRARFAGALSGRVFSFMAPVAAALRNLTLMPRIAEIMPPLRSAIDDCVRAGEWVRVAGVCGLPLCVLGGYERFSDEAMNPLDGSLAEDRMKPDSCSACAHVRRCSGVWKKYVEQYGSAEFVPIESLALPSSPT